MVPVTVPDAWGYSSTAAKHTRLSKTHAGGDFQEPWSGLPNDNHCWNKLLVGKSKAFFAANKRKSTQIGRDQPAISDASW